eukprot:TRINITY_DN2250_c2_g2_i1.p1 TRINITY_DN2250_c2_g2~~TRINITY_DN2250_c2_g2_i1.p1  ORF type:complete len:957 (+),score=336.20 TRINITY_DN2250_c2_g2_i1:81-2873(+)
MEVTLNPAELQRRCAQLDHKVRLLEKRLVDKDAERLELFQEAKLLHDEKTQLGEQLRKAKDEKEVFKNKISEVGKVCQQLLAERQEWRAKEQQLRRQAQDDNAQESSLREEIQALRARLAREESIVRKQEEELQRHIDARHAIALKEKEQQANREAAAKRRSAGTTQTDLQIDVEQRRLVEADAVASVGLSEAVATKVEVQQLRRKVMRLQASNATTQQACNAFWNAVQDQEQELSQRCRELEELRREKDAERAKMQQQIRDAEDRERRLNMSIANIRDQSLSVESAKKEMQTLDGVEREALRAQLTAAREELASMQEHVSRVEGAKESEGAKHTQLLALLRQEVARREDEKKADSEEIQLLISGNEEMMSVHNRVRQQRDQLLQKSQGQEDRIVQLQEELSGLEEANGRKLIAAQGDLADVHRRCTELQAELDSERALRGELLLQRQREEEEREEERRQAAPPAPPPAPEPEPQTQEQPAQPQGALPVRPISSPPHPTAPAPDPAEQPSHDTSVVEELRGRVQELEAGQARMEEEGEVGRLRQLLAVRTAQLEEKGRLLQQLTDGSPNEPLASASPPTRLQDLLHRMSQSSADGRDEAAPGLPPPTPDRSEQEVVAPVLAAWSSQLRKLVSKMCEALHTAHGTTAYLAQRRGSDSALLSGGVPINATNKYADPWWNKAFEVCSGLKYCVRQTQKDVLVMAAETGMLRSRLMQAHPSQQPSSDFEPALAAPPSSEHVYQQSQMEAVAGPRGVPMNLAHDPYAQQMGDSRTQTATSDAGADIAERHADIPPVDLDSTNTDPSMAGDDYAHCVQKINDSDELLRSAQGQRPFWGEARIASLQTHLAQLQKQPVRAVAADPLPVEFHSGAVAAVQKLVRPQRKAQPTRTPPPEHAHEPAQVEAGELRDEPVREDLEAPTRASPRRTRWESEAP